MSGRTMWRMDDCGYDEREWTALIGEEFGALGELVMINLERMAKKQGGSGHVKTGVTALARKVHQPEAKETVSHVVSRLVTLGYLVDYEEEFGVFKAAIAWFKADQATGQASQRKAAQRDRSAQIADDVTAGHAESRPSRSVTLREEEKLKEERENAGAETDEPDDAVRLCELLADLIIERDERARGSVNPADPEWVTPMRELLAARDGDVGEIERVMRWTQADAFWRSRAGTPAKLKGNFVQIRDQATEPTGGQKRGRPGGRRRAGSGQHTHGGGQSVERCPGCSDPAAIAAFEKLQQAGPGLIGADQWEIWLGDAHPHGTDGTKLVIGSERGKVDMVRNRFARSLGRAVGVELTVTSCMGAELQEAA